MRQRCFLSEKEGKHVAERNEEIYGLYVKYYWGNGIFGPIAAYAASC